MAAVYGALSSEDDNGALHGARYRTEIFLNGILYGIVIICGIFAEGIARNGVTTGRALRATPFLFKASIGADLTMCVADGAVAVLLARLLTSGGIVTALVGAA